MRAALGRLLCWAGLHRWHAAERVEFDDIAGHFRTVKTCARCGAERVSP